MGTGVHGVCTGFARVPHGSSTGTGQHGPARVRTGTGKVTQGTEISTQAHGSKHTLHGFERACTVKHGHTPLVGLEMSRKQLENNEKLEESLLSPEMIGALKCGLGSLSNA